MRLHRTIALLLILALLTGRGYQSARAHSDEHYFTETGFSVAGKFLAYWQVNGGLARFGFPISNEMPETSTLDGKPYTVQYFERAEFELHPENTAPYDVLLTQLGTFGYKLKYPTAPPNQQTDTVNPYLFAETGMSIGGRFRAYWQANGGLASFGYPISNQFTEKSDLNGKHYTVQYFERAVFELHPENQPPNDVLLSQLGRFRYDATLGHRFTIAPQQGRIFRMQASADYVVWLEDRADSNDAHRAFSYSIRSGEVSKLTDMARDYITISGSYAAWEEVTGGNCMGCVRAIVVKNLSSDKSFELTTDSMYPEYSYPAVSSNTLAWIKWNNDQVKLMTINLDSGQVNELASLPTGSINPLALSDRYIVWSETSTGSDRIPRCKLSAFDRSSGSAKQVAEFIVNDEQGTCQYALEGSNLFWTGGFDGMVYQNLDGNSQPIDLQGGSDPMIKDGIVVWTGLGLGDNPVQGIWGMKVGQAIPDLLVSSKDKLYSPQVAGDALIYQGKDGLVSVPLAQGFVSTINADPPITQLPTEAVNANLPYTVGDSRADHKISGKNILYLDQPDAQSPVEAYGYNLRTQRVFTSTGAAANGVDSNDSVLVWEQHGDAIKCPNCPITLVAEDILSGHRYDLGEGGMAHASYGHAVAWVKSDKNESGSNVAKLMYENLDSGQVTEVVSNTLDVRGVAISANYIAWQDATSVRAYNLKTGMTRTLASDAPRYAVGFALDGSDLVWSNDSSLFYADLDSDAPPISLYDKRAEAPTIKGDYVLWSSNGGFGECGPCDIWGLKLSDHIALQLIVGYPDIYSPQIAGDYLIWTDLNANQTLYTSLSGAFAAAGN